MYEYTRQGTRTDTAESEGADDRTPEEVEGEDSALGELTGAPL